MGCGRSRHGSPTLQPDGLHKDRADSREGGKRGGKKQKLSEKNAVKTASGWRERERERECVCVCVCVRERERERECVCVGGGGCVPAQCVCVEGGLGPVQTQVSQN